MKNKELLEAFGFVLKDNEYIKDNWTVRISGLEFELFSNPEIDTRYYFGPIDNLEMYLKAI